MENNETLAALQEMLKLSESGPLLRSLADKNHLYLRDLRINFSNTFKSAHLTPKEASLIAYAVALNEKNKQLSDSFRNMAVENGANDDDLCELTACVSLMNLNNVFYRFRHFAPDEYYQNTPAGIKMSIMMKPIMGKEFFELLSLCVSALNGCENCVKSHNSSVLTHGGAKERIYDAIRLSAVVKSLCMLVVA